MPLKPPTSDIDIDSPLPSPAQVGPVDVTYVFVYSSITAEGAKCHEPDSHIRIRSASEDTEHDGVYICSAAFKWRMFRADFTCLYDPATDKFSEFEVVEESMEGGIEDVERVGIQFGVALKDGNGRFEDREVKDERGNAFLVVDFNFGYSGGAPTYGTIYGKKALTGENWEGLRLSEEERKALEIEDTEWEQADD